MPVLISFGQKQAFYERQAPSFGRLLIDSGAFSAFNSGKTIDLDEFGEYTRLFPWSDACAALDDVAGDWQAGLRNWDRFPYMFGTYHESDPPEALDAIIERLQDQERARLRPASKQWIGLGMLPPRNNRRWLGETLPRIPPGLHVHGFAMRGHADLLVEFFGSDCSTDSTNWWLDARKILDPFPWLTPQEAVEIIVKRYQREYRTVKHDKQETFDLLKGLEHD